MRRVRVKRSDAILKARWNVGGKSRNLPSNVEYATNIFLVRIHIFLIPIYTFSLAKRTDRFYIMLHIPVNSCPFSTAGITDSLRPCKPGFIDAGSKTTSFFIEATSGSGDLSLALSGSSSSSSSIRGLERLILMRPGITGTVVGKLSNSVFPSMELFTITSVVFGIAVSATMLVTDGKKIIEH